VSERRAAVGIGVAYGALGAVLAYAVQRLLDAIDEPPMSAVLATAFIPYFWRVASSLVVGAAVGLGLGGAAAVGGAPALAPRLLGALPVVASLAAVCAVAAMLAVP
jgi:hypothetical protein